MSDQNNDSFNWDEFIGNDSANDPVNESVAPPSRPARPVRRRKKTKGLAASIIAFVMGLASIGVGFGMIFTQIAAEWEEDYLKDRYSAMYSEVIVDQTFNEYYVYLMRGLLAALSVTVLILSIVALVKNRTNVKKTKVAVFSIIGLICAVAGAVALYLSFTYGFYIG